MNLREMVEAIEALQARVERLEILAQAAGIEQPAEDTVAAGFAAYRARAKARERGGGS